MSDRSLRECKLQARAVRAYRIVCIFGALDGATHLSRDLGFVNLDPWHQRVDIRGIDLDRSILLEIKGNGSDDLIICTVGSPDACRRHSS